MREKPLKRILVFDNTVAVHEGSNIKIQIDGQSPNEVREYDGKVFKKIKDDVKKRASKKKSPTDRQNTSE